MIIVSFAPLFYSFAILCMLVAADKSHRTLWHLSPEGGCCIDLNDRILFIYEACLAAGFSLATVVFALSGYFMPAIPLH